ncbi:unnamed protein product [Trichobilharzia szidati]|nr:unnamed protein product [Trichobilharzia szidati]CAH8848815.1 unnamed protein product [Trichobilharzia szidati]
MTKIEPLTGDNINNITNNDNSNDEYQEFLKQFNLLNSISAEFRNICTIIGTELDSTLVRVNLINLQKYMMNELHKNKYQLMKCWRNANTGQLTNITSEQSDQLFTAFTTFIEYHMRGLLKTLHLLTLFPTCNITQNECSSPLSSPSSASSPPDESQNTKGNNAVKTPVKKSIYTDSSWVLSDSTILKVTVNSLIMTGFSKPLNFDFDTTIVEKNNDTIDDKQDDNEINVCRSQKDIFDSNLSEIDILKSEYNTLQKALNDISSLICLSPWNVLAFPVGIEQRLSLLDSTSTVHPPRTDGDSILHSSTGEQITASRTQSNLSASIGQLNIHLFSSDKTGRVHIWKTIRRCFKQRKVLALLFVGAIIIAALIILLILFIAIFPKMTGG